MKDMKGCIFDLDGTLVDSMWVWRDLGEVYLKAKGIPAAGNLSEILRPMTMKAAILYLKEAYAIEDSFLQMSEEVYAIVRHRYQHEVAAKQGAEDCLRKLKAKGVRMGVLTACERISAEQVLKRCGLLPYFDFIASCEELPYDKQDGRLYEYIVRKLKTDPEETMFVEDALHAVKALKENGYHVTAVYDAANQAQWKEICGLADEALDSLKQVE